MQKLSQTEELSSLEHTGHRHHALTTEQISRAMEEQDYDIAQLTSFTRRWRSAASI